MNKNPKALLIGRLSAGSGVNVETIRYYERAGLLPPPPRTGGRQRSYDEHHVQRLAFIRRSRELGFSLSEVRMLLELADHGAVMCSESVKQITTQHLGNVRAKIASLKKLERALTHMTGACKPGEQLPCPILGALSAPAAHPRSR